MPRISVSTRANSAVLVLILFQSRAMSGEIALDLEQRVVGMGAGQEMEYVADPRQRPAGELQRRDGIVEARRRRIGGDGRDLGPVVGERTGIGGPEMLGLDAVERGCLVGGGPLRQQRIAGGVGGGRGSGRAGHRVPLFNG
jgi:hypothetical protein